MWIPEHLFDITQIAISCWANAVVGHFVGTSLADDVGPTPCFSSGQRHAQQLAQPDILSANMLSTI